MKNLLFILTISSLTLLTSCNRLIETEDRTREICKTFTVNQKGELDYPNKRMSLFVDRSSIQFIHWSDKLMLFENGSEEIVLKQKIKDFADAEYHQVLGESKVADLSFEALNYDTPIIIDLQQYYYCLENKMEIGGKINGDAFGFLKEGYTRFKPTSDTEIKKDRNYQNHYLRGYSHNLKEYDKDKNSSTFKKYRGGRYALYLYPNNAQSLEYIVWDPELGMVEFKLFSKPSPFYRIFDTPTGK